MSFSIEVLRAKKGDCLLIHSTENGDPKYGLIDGGPGGVYQQFLKPHLTMMHDKLGADAPMKLEYVMISHVDDDHINGILDLLNDIDDTRNSQHPERVRIRRIWHNSFDNIIGNRPDELRASITAQFGAASYGGEPPDDPEISHDAAMILASIRQGHQLRDLAMKLTIPVNIDTQFGLIRATADPQKLAAGGVSYTLIGPMKDELIALQKKHDAWLRTQNISRSDGRSALAAFKDKSVPNLSSIVAVAESEGKSMLLTGDARGDKIIEGLELTGYLEAGSTVHFDLLKLQHHGSKNNVTTDFFRRVKADRYVISGNGDHGNPARETMEMLDEARGDDDYHLYFTYSLQELDDGRQDYAVSHRKPWDPATMGLVSFFDGLNRPNLHIHEMSDSTPHYISL